MNSPTYGWRLESCTLDLDELIQHDGWDAVHLGQLMACNLLPIKSQTFEQRKGG